MHFEACRPHKFRQMRERQLIVVYQQYRARNGEVGTVTRRGGFDVLIHAAIARLPATASEGSMTRGIASARRLEQEPGTALGLIDPHFDQAGTGDIPVL